jgi:hypothetical protein
MGIIFNEDFMASLLEEAMKSTRLRQNFDLRNGTEDTSQRMMNALQPGTVVPIHRHEQTSETVVCLCGKLEEIFYEECAEYVSSSDERGFEGCDVMHEKIFREVARYLLCPAEGFYGLQVPMGMWHSIQVIEPSVIFEAKDGAYIPR